ncbi:MAG: IS701 family transposase, partial [Desulfuromonadales bacterium]|nr:IS701 family transposase [Desulfuromonadales bacterium]NIR97677.1 IS701 family transposase [Gammaproteobacteria bacterium]NIT62997.1 IS701 family transposase [Gammaproteobacteria bacterium]NIV19954.1 IS701 family transposase [Gammaproteobacteria bacterium]NIY31577.1 IS701 family transposase [Gammaproteobacteria bacterium]
MAIPKAGAEPLAELERFLEPFAKLLRRSESKAALERYTTGLLADVGRKTASELGRSLPGTNGQNLQEFLTRTTWDAAQMDAVRIGHMLAHAAVGNGVLVVDDTGFAKKGTDSVGVARQYSGTLGRVDNCQVLVTVHYVDAVFDWPVNARLYLPESWTGDPGRCRKAKVPGEIGFATKGEIALALIDEARKAGVSPRTVVHDAGYGHQSPYLDGLEARELPYAGGIEKGVHFRLAEAVEADPGDAPPSAGKRGRPPKRSGLERRVPALAAEAILDALPAEAWQRVSWRDGSKGPLVKQCARVRVYRTARKGGHMDSAGWLIGERPLPGRSGDPKYYFAWGHDNLSLEDLVELVHVRWVIERFYQDAKGELGLDDYEGRLWHGLHRHVALVMLAHSFLTLQQSYGAAELAPSPSAPARGFPPQGAGKPARAPAP